MIQVCIFDNMFLWRLYVSLTGDALYRYRECFHLQRETLLCQCCVKICSATLNTEHSSWNSKNTSTLPRIYWINELSISPTYVFFQEMFTKSNGHNCCTTFCIKIKASLWVQSLTLCLKKPTRNSLFWRSFASRCSVCFCAVPCVCFCTDHFVMVSLNLTCLPCLQYSIFEHLFSFYYCYISNNFRGQCCFKLNNQSIAFNLYC